ncbi:ABC transporter substrate-binding protein [Alicyclobacillus fastidiosus]|uniref:Sugar ABC transporter substrate-binding protein n=1 Tax=Alicyclobacillus fastidiosus TaxID=392011 RepID=A0ABV5AB59_9BACL|nr:sugar ABC transporter substrate-binding protein [Alicyclobacillus fastidiosus]WEH10522.1 sugar ABC transporter substrate-binding protein [Alicyclobacillus fastidiosus]
MNTRKLSISATCFVLAGAVVGVSGCGSSSSANNASNSGKITITEMDYYTSTQGTVMQNMIAQYEKLHPNVKIQRELVPNASYLQKVLQEATAGDMPDLLMLDNPNVPDIASTGVLVPLQQLGKIDTGNFAKGSISEGTYNQTLYGLANANNTIALFYNKKLFQQAGIQAPPKTWTELRADAKKLTHGSVYGFAFSGASGIGNVAWQTEPFFWTDGGDLDQHIDSTGTRDTLNFLDSLVKDGSMPQAVVNWDQQDVQNQFQEGKVAMVINGPWIVPSLKTIQGLDYGIATIPVPKLGDHVIAPLGGEVWTIPKTSDKTEAAAFAFLKWLDDTKAQQIAWAKQSQEIPAYTPAVQTVVSQYPYLQSFATEVQTARSRTADLGANYPKAVDIWGTAVQSVLTGASSVDAALSKAQQSTQQMLSASN